MLRGWGFRPVRIPPFPQNKITRLIPGDFIFVNVEAMNPRLMEVI
jgi:hypothetical protein